LVEPIYGTIYDTAIEETDDDQTKLVKMIFDMDGDVCEYYDEGT
jgi:hypothetical protein